MTSPARVGTSNFRAQNPAVYVYEAYVEFFPILVTAYTVQGPRQNKTLIWSVTDGL